MKMTPDEELRTSDEIRNRIMWLVNQVGGEWQQMGERDAQGKDTTKAYNKSLEYERRIRVLVDRLELPTSSLSSSERAELEKLRKQAHEDWCTNAE